MITHHTARPAGDKESNLHTPSHTGTMMRMRNKTHILLLCTLTAALSGCNTLQQDTIVQLSALPIIEQGRIDGEDSLADLLTRGNFGLGHLDKMNGVLVILNGRPYHIGDDGNVRDPEHYLGVPFASVCNFFIDTAIALPPNCSLTTLRELIDTAVPDKELFCAIKVTGRFHRVAAQAPAPTTREEITANGWKPRIQRFPLDKVSGTLVGFRFPESVAGLQRPGYHFAFLADNLMSGGLVEDFVLADGTAEVDVCTSYHLDFPAPEGPLVHLPTP